MIRFRSTCQAVDASGNPFERPATRREPLKGGLADAASGHLTARDKTPLVLS